MKLATAMLALAVGWTGCAAGPTRWVDAKLGKPLILNPGEVGRWVGADVGGTLHAGIAEVLADSRCPKNVQCVWAGRASVRIWIQRDGGAREMRDLHTSPEAAQTTRIGDLALQLLDLTPHPVAGRPVEKASYAATLLLKLSPIAESDR